jgi:hypothetical protein
VELARDEGGGMMTSEVRLRTFQSKKPVEVIDGLLHCGTDYRHVMVPFISKSGNIGYKCPLSGDDFCGSVMLRQFIEAFDEVA